MPAVAAESATLTASASVVTEGDTLELSGTVSSDGDCAAGRPVRLQWRATDSKAWAQVGQTTTDGVGAYSMTDGQAYTGTFRAYLPETGSCAAVVVSNEVEVRVRARVESTLIASSLVAGGCVDIGVTIHPAKPGQAVSLQRRSAGRWNTLEVLTLDDLSSAWTAPCFGWEDIGVVRMRAVWSKQDGLNERGVGIELAFEIAKAPWMQRIDEVIGGRAVSVSAGDDGTTSYEHLERAPRIPASNEKLLLSMALLDRVDPDVRIPTIAAAADVQDGVVTGNLWLLGRGDPTVGPARLRSLARRIQAAGVTKVAGRVMGSTSYFRRDWWADGWRRGITRDYVAMPTALTYRSNVARGREIRDPERRAAAALIERLERLGIPVGGKPGAGPAPGDLTDIARVESAPLAAILSRMNRPSDNFYAETLGKLLAVEATGTPGTIAKGAAVLEAFAASRGVQIQANDGSGLSYDNRVTAEGIVQLLWEANEESWVRPLRSGLPAGGQGTLYRRLGDVRVRAKTGSLSGVSALSGWVYLKRERSWGEFSILCAGMSKAEAVRIEDRVVRILANQARL